MKKRFINVVLLGILIGIPALFNSCGNGRFESIGNTNLSSGGGGTLNSAARCESARQTAFKNTYWTFTKTACNGCHFSGGPGSGAFAATNFSVAYNAFTEKGEAKIYDYIVNGGGPSHATFTGNNLSAPNRALIESVKPSWMIAEDAYIACIAAVGTGGGGTEPPKEKIPVPSKFTIAKPFTVAAVNQPLTMTWNTENEMVSAADNFVGGTVTLTVTAADVGNNTVQYAFSNPRFVNTNPMPARVVGVAIKIDNVLVPGGTTFFGLNRLIPNIAGNNSRALTLNAGGAVLFVGELNKTLNIQVGFTMLRQENITFNPPTYSQLIAAGGIFQMRCSGCHGNAGGVSLANYNFVGSAAGVSGLPIVTKWTLGDSELYRQVEQGLMPTTGPLQPAEVERIRDWILDGAPNTPNDIRR